MAQIAKMPNGAYRITVIVGYSPTGKKKAKSMTWHPPASMQNESMIMNEATKVADEFERHIHNGSNPSDPAKQVPSKPKLKSKEDNNND